MAVTSIGCFDPHEDYYLPLTDPKLATSGSGGNDGGSSKPDCSGEPNEINTVEDCGVFVQADTADATGDGTRAKPYKTLQEALDKAGDKRVYACASAPFVEAVTISAGVEVFGGFACAKDWTWSQATKSVLNGPADQIALTLASGAEKAKVENFALVGGSASATKKGSSSTAVAVADVAAELVRCDVKAGDGAAGEDGVTPPDPVTKGADAAMPDPTTMNACLNPIAVAGGASGMTMCGGVTTNGGVGGLGGISGTDSGNGQKGADGGPLPAPNLDMNGLGGGGQADAVGKCKIGEPGADGTAGSVGAGGISLGTLSLSGLVTEEDTGGKPGTPGQGGGGGGGAKAGLFCPAGMNTIDGPGASGGGGGAGGCGGKGGGGGKAGGSSIAILSLGTKLVLTQVTLATGKGGTGGKGATGQPGGDPGLGASGGAKSGIAPSINGCKGGDGGTGGTGGTGGGGRGGHSIGLAYAAGPTSPPVIKVFTQGMPGDGGAAGQGAPMTSNGTKGAMGQCWDFGKNQACGL